jgi:SAM-dependent methyltransferase
MRMIILLKKITLTIRAVLRDTLRWMLAPKKHAIPFFPLKWLGSYSMNGKIKIEFRYSDGFQDPDRPNVYKKEEVDSCIEKIRNREVFYYGQTDLLLYQALEKFGIKNKEVAIMGSEKPVYESICLVFGGKPITIEYKKIISEDERLMLMTVDEYNGLKKRFDAAFSISSFEHDGLGRYGDPLNPDGDLLAMKKMKSILKPDGILFLVVPIGRDKVVWNTHRIYGRHRLPLLLKDWKVLEDFGFSDDLFNKPDYTQPVFVLKNIHCCPN